MFTFSSDNLCKALTAEGVPALATSYVNLHLYPMYQRKIAYGSKGFPWSGEHYKGNVSYEKGICPVAENLHDKSYLGYEMCMHELDDDDINLIVKAFRKVWSQLNTLSPDNIYLYFSKI